MLRPPGMGTGAERFEDLDVWRLADELRREVIAFTNAGPAARDFKYRDQIRDAAASAARNTAEGFGRFRPAEFARFLEFAHASLSEIQDALLDGRERGYLSGDEPFDRMWRLAKRSLAANTGLMTYLKDCAAKGRKPWLKKNGEQSTRPGTHYPRNQEPENPEPKKPEPENPEPENPEPENARTRAPENLYDRGVTTNPYANDLANRDPLEALGDTPTRIRTLTERWTPAQFERTYAPGKWTARQLLIHLAQTEMALGARARMALATTPYTSQPFDQNAWMARDAAISGADALNALVAMSVMNRALFASLSDADRATAFSHPEYGSISVDWLIHQMAGHQIHHLRQLETIATR